MGLFSSLLLIVLGLAAGQGAGWSLRRRVSPRDLERFKRLLQMVALLGLNPLAFLGALWVLPDLDLRLAWLPVVGLFTLSGAFLIGSFASRWLGLDAQRALLFRTGISYTNIGNIGGLAVFLILGEPGFALLPLYKLCEELWYYGFLFPFTKTRAERLRHPDRARPPLHLPSALGRVLADPFFFVFLGAVVLGFALHSSGLSRPDWYGPLNSWLVPTSSFLLLFAIGMSARVSLSPVDLRPALILVVLKITALPLVSIGLCLAAGFGEMPMVWKTALILSAMPMAFLSLVPPDLYGLDGKFPATAWALSMLSLLITLPVLWVLTS